ncbi:MAG TPA: methionine adenosyltransferase [Methanospirillum sp.]|uniref:methionine adenosyltransferase n=1 Tax=Methanospirillum sp. TaxID=45200 RepID=UPI002C97127F|nr:methionine adenosyltransferase [Methanospirillum sp.]HWQ64074.1 methionine adenosyltransferase [Methanospirillum sp.]
MKRNIAIDILNQTPLEQQQIELVERKCLGHPDSIADGIAESISQALCRNYIDQVGGVLHHNTDQGEIVAGESQPAFGGGKILKPIFILLDGRATKEFNGEKIPAEPIALKAAKDYLRTILPELDFDRDVTMDVRLGTGSTDLRDVFKPEDGTIPRANDTSFGVSFAPFSEIETCVREISSYIDNTLRPKYPAYGQDIKIMGLRQGDAIKLTLCCAMVDRYISSLSEYVDYRSKLQEEATRIAKQCTKRSVEVSINTADCDKECSLFLTVTGTSAEMGDDGSVGRGNRANGLITPHRPMSMEATSGKNPINHIGKIYNLLSSDLAHECVKKVDGLSEIQVRLLSQIGMPIDQPLIASVQIIPETGITLNDIEKDVYEIIDYGLENITSITERVIKGELKTF